MFVFQVIRIVLSALNLLSGRLSPLRTFKETHMIRSGPGWSLFCWLQSYWLITTAESFLLSSYNITITVELSSIISMNLLIFRRKYYTVYMHKWVRALGVFQNSANHNCQVVPKLILTPSPSPSFNAGGILSNTTLIILFLN